MPPTEQSQSATTRWHFPLPCVIGVLALLVYCLSLSRWASLSSIGAIARVSGWTWQPEVRQPLTCAVLYPFRFLPAAWLPFALNLFTAICASTVLGLLARSVILLGLTSEVGRDRQAQLGLPTAPPTRLGAHSVPLILATIICGLQLSFWEHATAFTGEMLDLLIFYLLLPIVQSLSSHSTIGFWPALKANLSFQKSHLSALRSPTLRLLAIASLLPILVLAIGWKTQPAKSGHETRRAIFLNRLASYPLHAIVLLLTLWLSFDPTFSPRHLSLGIPILSYYYLSALVAGYCAGYLLQVATEGAPKFIARFVPTAFCILAAATPLLLISGNLRQIRLSNGPSLHQFAREMYADLPNGKSVVLGTDFAQLSLLRA